MTFATWLKTFIEEKNLDLSQPAAVVSGPSGPNYFTYDVIVEHILSAPAHEQAQIKEIMIQIDFNNGDVLHFFRHLSQAIAV